MAIVLTVVADHSRAPTPLAEWQEVIRRPLAGVPIGLSAALGVFASAYWGLHVAFYGLDGRPGPAPIERTTHSHNPEQPHGPMAAGGIGAPPEK